MEFKSRPVLVTFAILAGLQVITNATGLSDVLPAAAVFLAGLVVAAVQTGMTFYVQGQVTPNTDVAAYVAGDGQLKAGPAAVVPTGLPVQEVTAKRD